MTVEDLASLFPPRRDPPLRVNYSNMDVYALPVPSGGPDLLFSPNVMELLGLSPESAYKNLTYQHLVEVNRVTFVLLQKWVLHCTVLLNIDTSSSFVLIRPFYTSKINAHQCVLGTC